MMKITNEKILEFRDFLQINEKAAATVQKYIRDVRMFTVWLNGKTLTKSNVLEYKEYLKKNYVITSVNAALSMIIMSLDVIGLISTQQHIFASTCTGVALSAIINMQLLRNLYYKLASKFEYYTSTYIAQILFFAVNAAAGAFFDNRLYAWDFSVTKFARFSHLMMDGFTSAIIFNIVMLLTIHLAPLGMGWLVVDEDYDYDE